MKDLEQAYLDYSWNKASFFEKTFLAHHGILGQKWGVRRYQNADGTLTEAGRKHYMKVAAKDVKKANDKWGPHNALRSVQIHKSFSENPAIKDFKDNSAAYKKYEEATNILNEKASDYSDHINKELRKKYGGKFTELDNKTQANYIRDGLQIMQEWYQGDEHKKLLKDVIDSSKDYEKDVNAFISKYKNSIMDRTTNDIAVKYDPNTGMVVQKTVNIGDVMSIEMLRDKKGRIYN